MFFTKTFGQNLELRISPKIESAIVYKDGTKEKGLVRMNNSVFDIRFKEFHEDDEKKVDFENVEKIITNPDSTNTRVFQYLDNYKHRFKMFVELIHKDKISIYINSSNELSLFYSDFDLRSAREWMNDIRTNYSVPFERQFELPNGQIINLPNSYSYFYEEKAFRNENSIGVDYYLAKEDQILIPVEKRKRFTKKYLKYFSECPDLVKAYKNEEISLENLPVFIEFYKETCN